MIRLPLLPCEPLLTQMRLQEVSLKEMNRRINGYDTGTAHRLATKPMRWYVADKFAVALGMHPAEIWGDDWWRISEVHTQKKYAKQVRYRHRHRENVA